MGRITLERTPARIKVDRLITALKDRPMNTVAAGQFLCITTNNAYRYLRKLHEDGLVHISGWSVNGDAMVPTPIYGAGMKVDAKRPKTVADKPDYERRRYRAMKKDPLGYSTYLAKARHRMRCKAGKLVKRDPFVAALFGG